MKKLLLLLLVLSGCTSPTVMEDTLDHLDLAITDTEYDDTMYIIGEGAFVTMDDGYLAMTLVDNERIGLFEVYYDEKLSHDIEVFEVYMSYTNTEKEIYMEVTGLGTYNTGYTAEEFAERLLKYDLKDIYAILNDIESDPW
jgi:hypothetical protein